MSRLAFPVLVIINYAISKWREHSMVILFSNSREDEVGNRDCIYTDGRLETAFVYRVVAPRLSRVHCVYATGSQYSICQRPG